MAIGKKKRMEAVVIGFDEVKDSLGDIANTVMYCREGNCSSIIQMANPVQQWCADVDQYYAFMDVLNNIIQTLGEGYCLQKQDIFVRTEYKHPVPDEMNYLSKCYFKHFEGRSYMEIKTFLVITQEFKKGKFLAFDAKKYKEFLSRVDKVCDILKSAHIPHARLTRKEIDEYLHRYVAFSFGDGAFSMTNIKGTDEFLKVGDYAIKCMPLVNVDDVALPSFIKPYATVSTNGFHTPTDLMSFLAQVPDAEAIVYNQVIIIPSQRKEQRRLEAKSKRHNSMPDPSNKVAKADIDTVLDMMARDNLMLVYANNTIIAKTRLDRLGAVTNFLETKIYDSGIGRPSDNAYNQYELFMNCCPGRAYALNMDYDLFLCLSEVALCLTYKEGRVPSEASPIQVFYTDRSGIPVGIDITGKEGSMKLTNNSNFFCLGPSGSGKSFHMNSVVRQLLEQDTDVVLVDVGDSYETLCGTMNGTYITYSKEKPISMNPFNISMVEYQENFGEKKNFLKSLIFLIFKGTQEPTMIEDSIINQVIIEYYEEYFHPFEGFNEEERADMRQQLLLDDKISGEYDKYQERLEAQFAEGVRVGEDQPGGMDETDASIPADGHMDRDKVARRANKFRAVINDRAATEGEKDAARYQLMRLMPEIVSEERYLMKIDKRIDAIEDKRRRLKVKKLNFNSFYEFALLRIPQITKESHVDFKIYDFKELLKKFYKGGELEMTLNNDIDSSLFDERFVIFEIDRIKDDSTLFPIVVLIIMDVFLQKMRIKKGRKALIIEEAWKAISSPTMADYIKYLYKTVRKFHGIAGVVTQELNDVIDSPIVKEAIIANSDVKILLDQSKFKDKFDQAAAVLGLTEVQRNQIFTIGALDNKEGRPFFSEVWICRGQYSLVLGVEEAPECYWAYTTERAEKEALKIYKAHYGDPLEAIVNIERDRKSLGIGKYLEFAQLVNKNQNVMKLWKN